MGCACGREHSQDQGSYSIHESDSPVKLTIQALVYDSTAFSLLNVQKFTSDHTFMFGDPEVRRLEKQAEVVHDGFLFTLNEIEFDEKRMTKTFNVMSFELTYDDRWVGVVALKDLRSALFLQKEKSVKLSNPEGLTIKCEILYSLSGSYYEKLRSLQVPHLSQDEQLSIMHKILQARNNESRLTSLSKNQIRCFLGEKETKVKLQIYEKLVDIEDGRSADVVKEFIIYYNPYQITLTNSFKKLMANVVLAADNGLEEYARNQIEIYKEDRLIYENVDSIILMLKQAFERGEDAKGFFARLCRNSLGTNEKVAEALESQGTLEKLIIPAFENDSLKAMKVFNGLMNFIGVEEFLRKNWELIGPLVMLDEVENEESVKDFVEVAKKLSKK